MKNKKCEVLSKVVLLLSIILLFMSSPTHEDEIALPSEVDDEHKSFQTYIVHVKKPESIIPMQLDEVESWYQSFLPVTKPSLNMQPRMVYPYQHVITGFAARLTTEETKSMREKDGVLFGSSRNIIGFAYNS
jgi:hypothetical protein